MFHLGVITDEISQDLDAALELAAEYRLEAVEIRSVWDKSPFELSLEEAKRVRQAVRARGLRICGISAPFYKCGIHDEAELAAHRAGLAHCAELAELWEAPVIRGFSFWREGPLEKTLPLIAERYAEPAELMRRHGLTLALESDPSVNACNASELARVLDAVGSPQVKALWDAGNDIYAPVPETPYPEGYEFLRGRIAHVHLKDAVLLPDGSASGCRFGEGLVDWKGQLAALARDGYAGFLVMETHYRLGEALSEAALKRPGGSAFSQGGGEPTRLCLESLLEMLRTL